MRYVVLLTVFLGGCASPSSPFPLAEQQRLGAWIALHVSGEQAPAPAPTPAPPQGDTCPDCGGKGTLGDGVVSVKCTTCNGTGRRQSDVAPAKEPITQASKSISAPPGPGTWRKVCKPDGTCEWQRVK